MPCEQSTARERAATTEPTPRSAAGVRTDMIRVVDASNGPGGGARALATARWRQWAMDLDI
eukprot:6214631-Pleurochrysis_carterae.AAC.2